ncbi:MAG TPA: polymer-forming cytoskeletal protein [Bacteroidia bacterium]|nr:polymer-forming cytoskeletal protein [Bacteroidia bacterium]
MFENLKNKNGQSKGGETGGSINLIGAGTIIEGDVKAIGDIRVDGTISGSVMSKAKVVVGSTGQVIGDVVCQNADISGSVKGKTTVAEMLFLKATAKINGDIVTGKLVVEVGASFTGNCNMGPMIKDLKNADKQSEIQIKEKTA